MKKVNHSWLKGKVLVAVLILSATVSLADSKIYAAGNEKQFSKSSLQLWRKQNQSLWNNFFNMYKMNFTDLRKQYLDSSQKQQFRATLNSNQPITESVQFTLQNLGGRTIYLQNSAPWRIVNSNGQTVFTPISLQVITLIPSGGSRTWSWDLKDNQGERVPSGTYTIVFDQINVTIPVTIQ
jgi:hypothetical protein